MDVGSKQTSAGDLAPKGGTSRLPHSYKEGIPGPTVFNSPTQVVGNLPIIKNTITLSTDEEKAFMQLALETLNLTDPNDR